MAEFKNFKLKDNTVILNENIEKAILFCDEFFDDLPCVVTDGIRTPKKVVEMILEECKKRGIDSKRFPEMEKSISNIESKASYFKNNLEVYPWQRAYCALIKTGFKINPPFDINLLDGIDFDKKSTVVKYATRHLKGLAFDISGREKMSEKLKRFQDVILKGNSGISNVYPERAQNCIHVNILG